MNIIKMMILGIALFLATLTTLACSTNPPPDAREPAKSKTESAKQEQYRNFLEIQSHTDAWLESERHNREARQQHDKDAFWRKQRS